MAEIQSNFQNEAGYDQREKDNHFVIIYVRGMEDLSPHVNDFLSEKLNVVSFSPDWKNRDDNNNFRETLETYHSMVQEFANNGQEIIVIGVSAGAGLAEAELLQYPENSPVRMIFSLNGVINPKEDVQDPAYKKLMDKLTEPNSKFAGMVKFLSENLTEKKIKALHLSDKIIAYTSGDYDRVVPAEVTKPLWLSHFNKVPFPFRYHAAAIFKTLVQDINKQLEPARSNKMR